LPFEYDRSTTLSFRLKRNTYVRIMADPKTFVLLKTTFGAAHFFQETVDLLSATGWRHNLIYKLAYKFRPHVLVFLQDVDERLFSLN
jgi:hypothetical protein